MKSIIPTVLIIVGITVLMLTATSVLTFQMQITGAKNFHSNCIDRIQASYGSEDEINKCIEDASNNGYVLKVNDQTVYSNRKMISVTLEYTAKMLLFNIEKTGVYQGYAR